VGEAEAEELAQQLGALLLKAQAGALLDMDFQEVLQLLYLITLVALVAVLDKRAKELVDQVTQLEVEMEFLFLVTFTLVAETAEAEGQPLAIQTNH
jgi:hypothetical protein